MQDRATPGATLQLADALERAADLIAGVPRTTAELLRLMPDDDLDRLADLLERERAGEVGLGPEIRALLEAVA